MLSRRQPSLPITLYSLLLCALPTLGHMEMSWPYPFRSKFNPDNTAATIDYSMTSPLSPDGSDFPCKGYQNDRPIETVVTYSAGSTYNITLAGSATHKGGSCQISLSYDNGATFRVIKSMIGGCPLTSTYDFDVPSYAPSGQALLAWTWQNEEGNREFYMNCAAVNVVSGAYRRRKRQSFQSFDQLPFIWKANLEGINDCTTTEGDDPVYPNPGPAVEYGNGYSSTSTPSPGACDSATPFGQTYKDLGDSTLAPPSGGESNTTSGGSPGSYTNDTASSTSEETSQPTPTQYASDDSMTESYNHGPGAYQTGDASSGTYGQHGSGSDDSATEAWNNHHTAAPTGSPRGRPVSTDTRSTVTVTADCASTVIITVYPTPTAFPTTSLRPSTMTTRASPTLSPTSIPRPPYATGSIESINSQYLPCTPNTFLCTSRTTFLTCNYNDGTVNSDQTWVYSSRTEKTAAAGMECLPYLSPSGRDDRYIRARPDGDCDVDGTFKCSAGGTQFLICDHGGWVAMGAVAAGTTCENGKIVASG